ncbi:MAG: hypothetical protein B6241_09380 [Spirochaetaceae bacterium 4572_59]|nr:MAG: hypothetical protein B6241_09380 [Spirochaetaceae bacterium 4572_59]
MEHTNPLEIIVKNDYKKLEMAIHPNDGEELNLYTTLHSLIFYAGQSLEKFQKGEDQLGEGQLHLLNECENGTLLVSEYLLGRLQFCEKAMLIRDDKKIFIIYRD